MSEDNEVTVSFRSRQILQRAQLLTAIWAICVCLLLVWNLRPDAETLKLNEWGDFIAGVFAPLAALWLVATVMLQMQELREQRRVSELALADLELSRNVMKAQATEAKRQAEFIETQTNIMLETYRNTEYQSICDTTVHLMASKLRQYRDVWHFQLVDQSSKPIVGVRNPIDIPSRTYDDLSDEQVISQTAMLMRESKRRVDTLDPNWKIIPDMPDDLRRVFGSVRYASELLTDIPQPYRTRVVGVEYSALTLYLADIERAITWPLAMKPVFSLDVKELKNLGG